MKLSTTRSSVWVIDFGFDCLLLKQGNQLQSINFDSLALTSQAWKSTENKDAVLI